MAIHDDPLPKLKAQLQSLQESGAGQQFLADQLVDRIQQENDKKAKWAVRSSCIYINQL